ncbi:MAG: DUF4293 domain-containing protein [Bacteroidota bacterium]
MIQRIQTVFLFLAIVAIILLAFFPLATFYSQTGIFVLHVYELESITPGAEIPFIPWIFAPLAVAALVVLILNVIALLSYKNRIKQIKLTQVSILLNILFIVGLMFYYVPTIEENTSTAVDYTESIGIYLPLISLVFTLIAQHFIKKDEKLVRSVDRLR